ncbi:hypothetical protein [Dickeya undicola]|uniref:Uncharacterized protein n=1 Tax=Dickeya undicola TaxID=1577887 RepID=A0A3N0FQN3_9GAMM|nr:hypothetical protein [Dickeya undicola]RNM02392.1 hypothetical protein EF878_20190 [Dickeya undicola]
MDTKQEIINTLQVLNKLLDDAYPTIGSHPDNKLIRGLHAEITKKLKNKYPYGPMDFHSEAF